MKVICNVAKDAINMEKHGVSLTDASLIDWDEALTWQDTRRDYGETRMVALAPIDNRLYCVVYVDRGNDRRIISLRKANQREFDFYEQETN